MEALFVPSRSLEAPLLTSVAVVTRSKLPVVETEAVVKLIESFVDPTPLWTLVKVTGKEAPKEGSPPIAEGLTGQLRLLKRISAREDSAGIDWFLKQKQFDIALDNAVRQRYITIAKWLVEEYLPTGAILRAVRTAIQAVNLEFLQWIHENHDGRVLWWRDALSLLPYEVIYAAKKEEVFAMVKWLHENVIPVDPDATSSIVLTAARLGCLEMLEWVLKIEKTRHWRTDELLAWAAWFGHRSILEWANDHLDATLDQVTMNSAVSGGQIELAQWLLREGLNSLSVAAFTDAVSFKRSEMIDWVFNNLVIPVNDFGPISDYVLASKGMLGVFQKLDRIEVKFSIVAMDSAATNGHLDGFTNINKVDARQQQWMVQLQTSI